MRVAAGYCRATKKIETPFYMGDTVADCQRTQVRNLTSNLLRDLLAARSPINSNSFATSMIHMISPFLMSAQMWVVSLLGSLLGVGTVRFSVVNGQMT